MQTNGWFTFVLVTVLALAALDAVAAWLNLRALSSRPPEGFADVVDAESHARSRDYTRVSTRHHLLEGAVSLALFLGFWWLGGFEWLDRLVRGWGHGPIVTGVLFTGILFLANHVAGLP
ncbi:MAG: M48 family peptidase, partial [Verrucomicrobiae bacterium]|nr:M48 family peptidase [Verrucomicrobiae bacterium]